MVSTAMLNYTLDWKSCVYDGAQLRIAWHRQPVKGKRGATGNKSDSLVPLQKIFRMPNYTLLRISFTTVNTCPHVIGSFRRSQRRDRAKLRKLELNRLGKGTGNQPIR
ncbi:hypothetical protein E2542_SST03479 [Spatholobus suberectus]|nr:hypothetical protein E2542_SST03479 [Spatholobus suberectus]